MSFRRAVWIFIISRSRQLAESSLEFGRGLGKLDLDGLLEKDLLAQLAQGRCVNLVAGYFYGLYWRRGEVSASLTATLDDMADANPEAAIFVTLHADISESGFRRVLRLTPQAKPGAYSLLEGLRGQAWPRLMSVERQVQVMLLLTEVGQADQPQAYDLALEMVCQWTPVGLKFSSALADALLPILIMSLAQSPFSDKGWYWMIAVGRLPDSHLSHKIDLLIEAVKEHISLRSDALSMLSEILRSHPTETTNILEAKLMSIDHEDRRLMGDLLSLFGAGQIETVQRLVRKLVIIGARALAKYAGAPNPTTEDPIHVPPMTAWLLDEFEEDDEVFGLFCAALHSNRHYVGGMARYFVGTEERVAPYLKHPLEAMRGVENFKVILKRIKEIPPTGAEWKFTDGYSVLQTAHQFSSARQQSQIRLANQAEILQRLIGVSFVVTKPLGPQVLVIASQWGAVMRQHHAESIPPDEFRVGQVLQDVPDRPFSGGLRLRDLFRG